MTKEAMIEEIRKHSKEEQREIIEAVWEPGEEDDELGDEQRSELKRRYDEYKRSPLQGAEWSGVRARVERALG